MTLLLIPSIVNRWIDMDIIKKRITVPILVLLLIFVSLSQIPATFGKYVSDTQTGTLWESIFEGESVDYSDIFYITGPGYSDNLYGFDEKDDDGTIRDPHEVEMKDENGNVLTDSRGNPIKAVDFYELTEAVNVSFPVYNGSSDTTMLICFEIGMCMNYSVSGTVSTNTISVEGVKIKNDTQSTGTVSGSFSQDWSGNPTNPSTGLTVTKSEKIQYEGADVWGGLLASGDYYLYTSYLNTYAAQGGNVSPCFILKPGESATYSISFSGAQEIVELDKIYSSINLVAVECDENGKPVDS